MYSPKLNPELIRVLYRVKRAYQKPMTEITEQLILEGLKTVHKEFVCKACIREKNNKCKECYLCYRKKK